jgi:hypothetical protein
MTDAMAEIAAFGMAGEPPLDCFETEAEPMPDPGEELRLAELQPISAS